MKTELTKDAYPLSPMQQGMLFHCLSLPRDSSVDVEQIYCTLHEDLNVVAFQSAWKHAVDRHAILRTSFHWQDAVAPRQQIHERAEFEFSQDDWSLLSKDQRDKQFSERLEAERSRGFDLAAAPLMRLAVFRHDGGEWRFLWTFHHLLLDGRSVVMLLNEVFALYEALSRGASIELPAMPSYGDFVAWLQQQDPAQAESFWRSMLKGFAAPTPLVVGRNAGGGEESIQIRGEQQIHLPEAATAALKSFAKENKLTLNTMVQGAWALLLSRYSGEEDVLFGAVRACRHSTIKDAESVVGLCINTVPLRIRVPAEGQLLPWLAELRNQWLALRPFEHTPLTDIQGWSDVPRGCPLFESIFNFQDPSWYAALRAQGGKWATREFGICSQSNYPLVVDAYGGDEVIIKILYHRTRFDDATIGRMLGHFKTLLEGMAANPGAKLSALPMLTKNERQQLLEEWNETRADFPQDKCVHQLFEEQAARTPDALAVADESTQLTYSQLNARANLLAVELEKSGVGPEVCAGVCLERSVEMVVAMLAVLKAGGAYVPIDPGYPDERLTFMLEDAKIPVLITRESIRKNLKFNIPNLKIICMGSFDFTSKAIIDRNTNPKSSNLAYVIYTSGSTGTPKGVMIEHASLVNLITWHQRVYNVTPADRATQIATPAFDACVWELWPYLTAGASIHIPREETRLAPEKLPGWLAAKKITLSFIPTPVAEMLLDGPWPAGCALRALLTGGDKLHHAAPANLPCALVNHYGPTESTVVTTCTVVPPDKENRKSPPIGRPIANTQVYILDNYLQPVPVGVPGQLHIGGAGLARGYHNLPELTAEKFIPNPFNRNPAARLYKTGDLVLWLPDGQIEFLSRMDNQVKIRGQRIELGEIEAALIRHEGVREAIVVVCDDGREESRLAAYVVPAPAHSLTPHVLREYLKQKLPGAMVPSAFVFLDTLPLTPNGKVDRKTLPPPDFAAGLEKSFVAPRTSTEKTLAEIWGEVLGLKQIGVQDDFFELGGHSLRATQVLSRVINAFHVELPLQDLFSSPTVEGLAAKIDAASHAAPAAGPAAAQLESDAGAPLAFAQERVWFMERLEPGLSFNNVPAAIQLEGDLNIPALQRAIAEIIHRHKTLRTAFNDDGGRAVAVIVPEVPLAMPIVDMSLLTVSEREAGAKECMLEEARRPFNLATGPLLRVKLVRLARNRHLLLLTMHHIVWDGWSMGVFYREVAALYEAFSHGKPSSLPELQLDYADFARWQRERVQAGAIEEQLGFWKKQLNGAPPALDLPADRPRPSTQTYRGAAQYFALPGNLAADLMRVSRKENITLFMLLLAAFQTLLHRFTRQEDILVGSPIAGRTRIETEGLIGLFLNTLVLRGDLSGDPTFRELLRRTHRVALDAYAHQDVPFEKVVDAVQPGRDLSRTPLFQVMFILQNEPLRPLELAGLKLTPLPTETGTAKLDLLLSMEENDNGLCGFIEYNTDVFSPETIERMLGNYQTLLQGVAANAEQRLSQLPLLSGIERRQILTDWNKTGAEFEKEKCIHQLFEEQVERSPDAVAMVFEEEQFTYRELNARANQLAAELQRLGVGPDTRVGICVKRSLEMMVGLLAILKAGGCYVPLDPAYPKERLAFMLEDAQMPVLLTQSKLQAEMKLDLPNLKQLCIDAFHFDQPATALQTGVKPENLAYVMYTSGSTGKPKGVMVTHRNVVNFVSGIDALLGKEPGVWLAVTSISFDISVLELFWTLVRGFKVIIQSEEGRVQASAPIAKSHGKKMDFSLFYFANDTGNGKGGPYQLLLNGAKFADEHEFAAVWTPERHFHSFGAPYPNPSVTSAALAMVTKRLQIRAGSVVLPLHHPARIAEEWSVVDNLSNGRVAVSFASGWHDRDFVLAPGNYENRKELMFSGIETVRKLWRGESVPYRTGGGVEAEIKIFPRPVQKELPVWITAAGHPETFRRAGELGANLLTHLLGQSQEDLAAKIRIYRAALAEHHEHEGKVALMLHTFVGQDLNRVRDTVRQPFCDYLKSSTSLLKGLASAKMGDGSALNSIPEQDMDALAQRAFDRYSTHSGLLGTPESCLPLINQLKAIGVDEVACLIDFGVDHDLVMAGLPDLNRLKELSDAPPAISGRSRSVAEQILHHGVTHMQCTPTLARTLLAPESQEALRRLRKLLVGGEALPVSLAQQLRKIMPGEIINMYGPTETTVWSAVHRLDEIDHTIPIGRPIANTEIYLLDKNLQPVPIGVPGEIFIGGEGVTRGYLHRPELTAEKFLAHPFSSDANARLYRTGDLGRFRAGGTIEFLGRIDHQVKIRGHRIELSEIELVFNQHPTVREMVVAVREDSSGDKRLIAYVVAAANARPTTSELRRFAQDKLPDAMTPSVFVFLDALPLTPNGKVNRQALPAPEGLRPELETAYIAPGTSLEKTIAKVWRELLGIKQAGLHDNFFDLGGNSLLVVQAQARLREALGRDLPVVKLFQYPTINALAGFLDKSEPATMTKTHDRGRRMQAIYNQQHKNKPEVMA
jgi:natural product biosynthesis luciferase-like monooxygenase protein/amino acid adenylation domain-containing protein